MFSKNQFNHLFEYHFHTSFRLVELASNLSEADYRRPSGYGHSSIHALLLHLLQTDWTWRQALETGQQLPPLPGEDFPDLGTVKDGFAAEQAAWQALLEKLEAKQIEMDINLTTRRGSVFPIPYWRVLQHVVLHGMQHHAELAQLLTAMGQSPGNLDFIFFGSSR